VTFMSEPKRFDLFVSVNPDLRSRAGHPFHLDCALRKVAERSGLKFVSFGNKQQDEEIKGLDFLNPVFSSTSWQVFFEGTPEIVSSHVDEFREGLKGLRERSGEDARIFVYWYMGSAEVFAELSRHASELTRSVFCLHLFSGFFCEPGSFTMAHLWHAGVLLERLRETGLQCEVISDSEKLIRDLELHTGATCKLVPAFASQELSAAERDRPSDRCIRVVYPTDDSSKRGFDLLLEFLQQHAVHYSGSLEFVVRVFPGNSSGVAQSLASELDNVEILEGQLTDDEFHQLLCDADVVILPYLKELFYYRTSSILYEAMALRKPVVVVEETWLSERVSLMGGGWIAEATVEGLAATFDVIAEGGRPGLEEKIRRISAVPQVEDLFSSILSLPYEGEEEFTFEPKFSAEDVENCYQSEKGKTRLQSDYEAAGREIAKLERKIRWLESELDRVVNSKTWRYTESLRGMVESVKEWRMKK